MVSLGFCWKTCRPHSEDTIANLRSIQSHKPILLAEGARADNFTSGELNLLRFYGDALVPILPSYKNTIGNQSEYTAAKFFADCQTYWQSRYERRGTRKYGGPAGVLANFVGCLYEGRPFLYNGWEVAFAQRILP
jgi:hypothetical protein